MTAAMEKSKQENFSAIFLFLGSILITGFLFFIDEGNYNFEWMANAFAWAIFAVYAISVFLCQLLVFIAMPHKYNYFGKLAISTTVGAGAGIFLLISILS